MKMKNKDTLTSEKIYVTTDYNKFKFLKENREIYPTHVNRLVKSIKQRDVKIPIIVDRDFNILEGQHRYEAYKKLSMPIHYSFRTTIAMSDIRTMNVSTQKWNLYDFLHSYKQSGNKEYIHLDWFVRTYKFGIRESVMMCTNSSGSSHARDLFKSGKFKVKDLESAKLSATRINAMKEYYAFYRKRTFIYALLRVFKEPGFEWHRFWNNVQKSSGTLKDQGSRDAFIADIVKLYNHRTPKDKKIWINVYD